MYDQDPRDAWTPAMSHYFPAIRPDESMFDLTPARLEALVASTQATQDATETAAGGAKPIPRRKA